MATTTRNRVEANGTGARPRRPEVDGRAEVAAAGARNRTRILVGALLALGSALVVALLYAGAGERTSVLVVMRPVAAGQVLEADDLGETTVAVDGDVRVVPADERASIVGLTAAVPLAPGSLLIADQVGSEGLVDAADAVFGAVLADGSYPPGLRAGDEVLLFELPLAGAEPKEPTAVSATVASITLGEAPATVSASLAVAPGDVAGTAIAAGQDRLIVVLAPR